MAISPLLVTQHGAGDIKVFRMGAGGTLLSQIGPTITGVTGEGGHGPGSFAQGYAIEFHGKIFVGFNETPSTYTVYRFDSPTWTQVFSGATTGQAGTRHTALHTVIIGGVQSLCVLYDSGGNDHTLAISSNGSDWTTSVVGNLAVNAYTRSIVWRNTIYVTVNSATHHIMSVDTTNGAWNSYSVGGWTNGTGQGSLCVFRNRLFIGRAPTAGSAPAVYELSGGTFVLRASPPGGQTATMLNEADHALVPVGDTKMLFVCVTSDGSNHGSRAFDIYPSAGGSLTFVEVTSPVIPASLRPTLNATFQSHRWECFVDNEESPDQPTIHLWHLTTGAGSGIRTYYSYTNSTTALGGGLVAPDASFNLPSFATGGGDRVSTSGSFDISVVSVTPIVAGVRIGFIVRSPTVVSDLRVSVQHSPYEGTDLAQATLFGTATGGSATRSGNEIQQVTSDGVTVYTLDWHAEADGYVASGPSAWLLRVEA